MITLIMFFLVGFFGGRAFEKEKYRIRQAKWIEALNKSVVDIDIGTKEEPPESGRMKMELDFLRKYEESSRDEAGWPEEK